MERRRISSGAAFEQRVGYSRAVRVGQQVWVSGTAPIMPGDADPPDDPYEQAVVCLGIIERALAEAGATLDDVVRTRIYVTRAEDIEAVGRAHREAFGTALPATTGIVAGLLDPRWRVEIEAEAILGEVVPLQQMSSGFSTAITRRDAASSVASIVTTIDAPCVLASLGARDREPRQHSLKGHWP